MNRVESRALSFWQPATKTPINAEINPRDGIGDVSRATAGTDNNLLGQDDNKKLQFLQEEDMRPTIYGVVTVHIKDARKLFTDSVDILAPSTYIKITVRNLVKRSAVVQATYGKAAFDQVKHFPVTVIRNKKHPFNILSLQLLYFRNPADPPAYHLELGSVTFNLHEIIRHSPIQGYFDLTDQHQPVGEIGLGITFQYGLFGYGYSWQLKEEHRSVESFIKFSLFPRVPPPEDRQETTRCTIVPRAVPHPGFIPFRDKVVLGYGKDIAPLLDKLGPPDDQRRYPLLCESLKQLAPLVDHYNAMDANNRIERLAFLRQRILSTNLKKETLIDDSDAHSPGMGGNVAMAAKRKYIKYVQPTSAVLGNAGSPAAGNTSAGRGERWAKAKRRLFLLGERKREQSTASPPANNGSNQSSETSSSTDEGDSRKTSVSSAHAAPAASSQPRTLPEKAIAKNKINKKLRIKSPKGKEKVVDSSASTTDTPSDGEGGVGDDTSSQRKFSGPSLSELNSATPSLGPTSNMSIWKPRVSVSSESSKPSHDIRDSSAPAERTATPPPSAQQNASRSAGIADRVIFRETPRELPTLKFTLNSTNE